MIYEQFDTDVNYMFLVLEGKVELSINDITIKVIEKGNVFGDVNMER